MDQVSRVVYVVFQHGGFSFLSNSCLITGEPWWIEFVYKLSLKYVSLLPRYNNIHCMGSLPVNTAVISLLHRRERRPATDACAKVLDIFP